MSDDFEDQEILEENEEIEIQTSSKQILDPENVTDEQLDEIADCAIDVLQSIFLYFETSALNIDEYLGDEGELILDISGDDLAILIGRHGKTLEALQYIVSTICFRKLGYRFPIIVDIEGYKSRMKEKLESIARSSAKRAIDQHRAINLRPMSAYDRRIIHMALRNNKRVKTQSDGEGSDRHVVIYPVN